MRSVTSCQAGSPPPASPILAAVYANATTTSTAGTKSALHKPPCAELVHLLSNLAIKNTSRQLHTSKQQCCSTGFAARSYRSPLARGLQGVV